MRSSKSNKLSLQKITVRRLDAAVLAAIVGGTNVHDPTSADCGTTEGGDHHVGKNSIIACATYAQCASYGCYPTLACP